jgi:Mrp family chromosome partitioning ATPase
MIAHTQVQESQFSIEMELRGGPRKIVSLAARRINPALVFANEQLASHAAGYQDAADRLLHGDWWMPRRMFVTSPSAGDGKTTTAFNLAWALTTRGKKVLLVELNLAQPRFQTLLGNPRIRHGVDSVLRRTAPPNESVFSLGSSELHVAAVRSQMQRVEAKEYLRNLDAFLDWGEKEYEWLVMDCPAVLSPMWNGWFSAHVQEALLVVRSGRTALAHVRKATKVLGDGLRGVLLNDVADESSRNGSERRLL